MHDYVATASRVTVFSPTFICRSLRLASSSHFQPKQVDIDQIMLVLVAQNIYLFAAETRASRAALAARRASHAEASCSAKRCHSSMAPPQLGPRRSSSSSKSQRPHQQARHEESLPGVAGEELVDATVVSHEFIGPQPVSHESIGPQSAALPDAAEQDRLQPAALRDGSEPGRSADEAADIPATASQPDDSNQLLHDAMQDAGHESTSNAEPVSQSALLGPAGQSDAAAPGSTPSSGPHIVPTDQSEPPDPGDIFLPAGWSEI